jgi:hypothetical protein
MTMYVHRAEVSIYKKEVLIKQSQQSIKGINVKTAVRGVKGLQRLKKVSKSKVYNNDK